ncbi:SGNH-hydrolase lipoprotein, lysophospholipase L1-like subgroup [Citrifermentans bemidjiense Bem]|uniref:SGNH-hydrolase lipoprotein, lysophospholipase L1-like subgroup n=1 Tax=Citrifermentans bemidjiense (strain ATCC BAA-1014 / DSM 16622 / JCM 12645 / Bem) TaxID=404380 RepID=B5ECT5_CITBB|nr:arylesterase [Citrifermentans bemidjiense]ACH39120.1 SGNH-hydrolase lipoprotein, lysophospholipase L1-like subgroup [Citrifermentans bemidjiense Bem]
MCNLRFIALTIIFAVLLVSCHKEKEPAAVNATEKPASRGTIVAVGDSLTAGYGVPETDAYPAQLERKLNEAGYKWRVVNAGISGETSTGTLARIDWILKLRPDIVILETGANDGLRGQAPELTRKNTDSIVTALQAKNVVVVLAGMQMLTNMGSPYRDKFVAIYPRVAKERKLILVPFFLDKVAGEENLNLSDGIHPNPQGYAIVTETIFPYVLQAIKLKTGS